ncbi:hypothetical protein CTAYLR_009144 [Chrysophaeum taylorii]|uniref:EF-hand domain-containing protein n=1 Tax=Chrysophaeum taylorii TaxID=2483200 RepID=A0AAD7UMF9_9STRA|nr:hypothetical protein CTAYLR_009144 [Chrysophaeum taylorii]
MGNDVSAESQRTSYVAAMASVTALERKEMLAMRDKLSKAAQLSGSNPNTVSREDFGRAIEEIGVTDSDLEILDRLFTMFDKLGDGEINFREMVVGLSPLARGTAPAKLALAFELYDLTKTDHVKPAEMVFILNAINNVASWLGDPVVNPEDVHALVDDVFEANFSAGRPVSPQTTCKYADAIDPILGHHVAIQFLSGAGRVKLEP